MIDISVKNLTKFFVIGENLLEGLSFDVQEGECVAILGRNGCGKTTLLSMIIGKTDYDIGPQSQGKINYSGSLRIGYLEQGVGLSADCSIEEEMRKPFAALDAEFLRMSELAESLHTLSGQPLEDAQTLYNNLQFDTRERHTPQHAIY